MRTGTEESMRKIPHNNTSAKNCRRAFQRPGATGLALLSLILVSLLIQISPGLAAEDPYSFTRMGFGARALGMGGAHVALSEDAFSTFWNPAGLGWTEGHQLGAMYSNIFNFETNLSQLSYAIPVTDKSTGALGFKMLSTDSIPVTSLNSSFQPIISGYTDDNAYELKLSYGYRFGEKFSSGFNMKYIHHQSDTLTGKGWGLDWGVLYKPTETLRIGANVKDVTGTDVKWDTQTTDTIPLTVTAGVLGIFLDGKLNLEVDVDATSNEALQWHVGSEYWFNKILAIRAGSDRRQFTMGMTYNQPRWSMDYAYLNHRMEDIHRFSFNLFLDEINKNVIEDRRRKKKSEEILEQYNIQPKDYKQQEIDRILALKKEHEVNLFAPEKSGEARVAAYASEEPSKALPGDRAAVKAQAKDNSIFFDEDVPTPPHGYDGTRRVPLMRATNFTDPVVATDSPQNSSIPALTTEDKGLPIEAMEKSVPMDQQELRARLAADTLEEAVQEGQTAIPLISSIRTLPRTEEEVGRDRKTRVTPEKAKELAATVTVINSGKKAEALAALKKLKDSVIMYNGRENGFLTSLHQLTGKYETVSFLDPWGSEYKVFPMEGTIRSSGPDRVFNNQDDVSVNFIE